MIGSPRQYFTLVGSLPYLPRIGQTDRLPINEARLESRLNMLDAHDAEVVASLRRFIHWQNSTAEDTDAVIAAQYNELLEHNPHPASRSAIQFRMDLRTILAALRRRKRGEDAPPTTTWGVGKWVPYIESNWSHPDFRLSDVFPWVPEAQTLLQSGRAMALETLAMNLVWDALDRTAQGKPFQIEAVITFVFQWDILRRWLDYRPEAAKAQFESLTTHLFPDGITALHPTHG